MSVQEGLFIDILDAIAAFAQEQNKVLPSWFANEEDDIIHPVCSQAEPTLDGDWWSDKNTEPVVITLIIAPEVRLEAEYHVRLLPKDGHTVVRITNSKRSAVTEPAKWISHALSTINHEDRKGVQVKVTIQPSLGGNTMFRKISEVSYNLVEI
ncbi:MAG: hypothetical protein ACD_61C00245G0001 [uncultured bacterium]|nr:MAG: hypothetical protein ACD_61C00245G0001 [uncultured bacterium]